MATPQPFPIASLPGIKRDGTAFEGNNYSLGSWCRFTARGLPKKIAGYQQVTAHLPGVVRGMDSFAIDTVNYVHMGSADQLVQQQVGFDGSPGVLNLRTPAAFAADANNLWQITAFYNKINGKMQVIAHAAPNLADIANSVETPIYYGDIDAGGALVASAMDPISGGVLALPPYLLAFSNSGRVDVSAINDPTAATGASAFVTAQKIVKGLSVRSQGGPAALLWSLDSLVSVTFDVALAGPDPFDYNEIDTSISVLSEQGIIEFDGIYYWAAVDRFSMFNGVVRELPNNLNVDFFFDNVNMAYRQKVFAFKVPRYGEIWWCFPFGSSTECNHAVIFNTRLNTWYDTPLPDGGRSAGLYAKVYSHPLMCDVDLTATGYSLWQHETGLDKVAGSSVSPITSFYHTHESSPLTAPQHAVDKAYRVGIVEADFKQVGDLTCNVYGRANARVEMVKSPDLTITPAPAATPNQMVELKQNARLLSFRFTSNAVGGDFVAGQTLAHIEQTDGRFTQ